ncbi:hypothetical protein V6N11_032980 [Hibiscus sabdariffa]|uniref:Uncharacterized protein n=1 Tax=Hibiscus sabdariffa TaxID=183260 RepID=A0ABR1Z8R1_9ROSI
MTLGKVVYLGRNFKHELKLASQTLLFPVQNGNYHLRGFYSPKMSVRPVRDSKNILPASISCSMEELITMISYQSGQVILVWKDGSR